jgi:hypothetical protein
VIVYEVVVDKLVVVEKLHEHSVVINERACNEWVAETLNWHGVVIDTDC